MITFQPIQSFRQDFYSSVYDVIDVSCDDSCSAFSA